MPRSLCVELYAHLGERPTPMTVLMVILIAQPLESMNNEIDASVLPWYFLASIYGVRSDLHVINYVTDAYLSQRCRR